METIHGGSRGALEKIILLHLKQIDKDVDCDDSEDISAWKSNFESEIIFAWIVRIIEDKLGNQIIDQNEVNENISVIVETIFQEISKTLQYVVNDSYDLENYSFELN